MSNIACVLSETGTAYYSRAPEFNPGFLVGMRVGHFFQVWFAVSYYMSLCSEFRVMTSVTQEWCSVRVYLQLFVGGLMSYLRYLCLFAHSGVQSIMSCVFLCLCPVYPMLPVSLDCSFLIVPSLFYNVYLCVILTCRSHYINVQVKVNYFALLNLKKNFNLYFRPVVKTGIKIIKYWYRYSSFFKRYCNFRCILCRWSLNDNFRHCQLVNSKNISITKKWKNQIFSNSELQCDNVV
jgi:hypothetical protein